MHSLSSHHIRSCPRIQIRDFIYEVIGERKMPKQTVAQLRETLDESVPRRLFTRIQLTPAE